MTIQSRVLRNVERKRVLMKATVINADGTSAVRVTDLTGRGAKIVGSGIFPTGEDLIFNRGDLFVAARVAWSNRTGAGLEFYREIPASKLAATFHPVFEIPEAAE